MKSKIIKMILGTMFLFDASAASAAAKEGDCVYPKTRPTTLGIDRFARPVYLYSAPSASASKKLLTTLTAFSVQGVTRSGFIQLVTVPDYDKAEPNSSAGKVLGWAKYSDFDQQALRNCS
jgi:hypothetical protein